MAILAGNVPEWTIVDVATIAAGGVGVGIYPTSSPEQCEYIINHSDAEFVFVDSSSIDKVADKLPKVKEIICLEKQKKLKEIICLGRLQLEVKIAITNYKDFLEFGRQNRDKFLPQVEEIGLNAKPEDIAIMVYTSGTTGKPKGAMLSHQYILNSCRIAKTIRSDFSR